MKPVLAVVWLSCWMPLAAQVSFDRLLHAGREPQNWLTYAGGYQSWRYSPLDQIRPGNASNLELKWVYQLDSTDKFEATPLVVDGTMYFSQPPSDVIAVDAKTGRAFWTYRYRLSGNVGVSIADWQCSGTCCFWRRWTATWSPWTPRPDKKSGRRAWWIRTSATA